MKRVKTALLFNDKYKQGYSYIMASQIQLDNDIAIAKANIARIQAQLDAAREGTTTLGGVVIPPDPAEIADLEFSLSTAKATLASLETQLANLTVVTDPNSDPNTNIGEEAQDLVYEPLQEPPATTDGDEFTGIDEQVERQRQLEDGLSLIHI